MSWTAVVVRWRTEIALVTVAIVAAHVLSMGASHRTTLIRALITASVLMAQRETRRWVVDRAHCLLTRHRLYKALEEVQTQVGGQLPLVLRVRPSASGEKAFLWRRHGGITAETLHLCATWLAVACWAKEAHVHRSTRWPRVIIIEVVRHRQPPDTSPASLAGARAAPEGSLEGGPEERRYVASAASRQ
jgi:hypothetical protein